MKKNDEFLKDFTKLLVVNCVRNTFLEDLHCGTSPSSKTGDYSDVKVVSPYGEIPWNKLSRISDEEMKKLMKEIVNKVYTMLAKQKHQKFLNLLAMSYPSDWDEPELDDEFMQAIQTTERKS